MKGRWTWATHHKAGPCRPTLWPCQPTLWPCRPTLRPGRPHRDRKLSRTYITLSSSSAPSLQGFSPFLTFHCGQSAYVPIGSLWTTMAPPPLHQNVPSATKGDILRCSASISCALLHLNAAELRLQEHSDQPQNISLHPQCPSKPRRLPVPVS